VISPGYGDICSVLDAAKVADCLLLTVSASAGDIVDSYTEHCLSCLLSQGLPACVICIQVLLLLLILLLLMLLILSYFPILFNKLITLSSFRGFDTDLYKVGCWF